MTSMARVEVNRIISGNIDVLNNRIEDLECAIETNKNQLEDFKKKRDYLMEWINE